MTAILFQEMAVARCALSKLVGSVQELQAIASSFVEMAKGSHRRPVTMAIPSMEMAAQAPVL